MRARLSQKRIVEATVDVGVTGKSTVRNGFGRCCCWWADAADATDTADATDAADATNAVADGNAADASATGDADAAGQANAAGRLDSSRRGRRRSMC